MTRMFAALELHSEALARRIRQCSGHGPVTIIQAVDFQEKMSAEKWGNQSRREPGCGFGGLGARFSTMLSTEWVDSATASRRPGQNQRRGDWRFGHNSPRRGFAAVSTR
jgi:hypothetical protein